LFAACGWGVPCASFGVGVLQPPRQEEAEVAQGKHVLQASRAPTHICRRMQQMHPTEAMTALTLAIR
jgi:hypothetical protein